MIRNRYIMLAAILLGFASCNSSSNSPTPTPEKPILLEAKASSFENETSANPWKPSDRIGVFMLKAGESFSDKYAILAENKMYGLGGSGLFEAITPQQGVYFPSTGNPIDLYAYYPYQQNAGEGIITIAADGQTDCLYAATKARRATDFDNGKIQLDFKHCLAKIILDYKGTKRLSAGRIQSVYTHSSFNLLTATFATPMKENKEINMLVEGKRLVAYLLPQKIGAKLLVTLDSKTLTKSLSTTIESGKAYIFSIDDSSDGGFEITPSGTIVDWDNQDGGEIVVAS